LSRLTSKTTAWHWTNVEQKAKPHFNKPFIIHTDASHTQLGAVISQDNKPITFYSHKLNPAQTGYTTTERELLSIVETLKEFRNYFLVMKKVYTDHKNLTYTNFNTERVMRWHLILEEYLPELIYLKGESNIVTDALSRLELVTSETPLDNMHDMQYLADHFSLDDDDLPANAYPLQYETIALYQNKQLDHLTKIQKHHEGFHLALYQNKQLDHLTKILIHHEGFYLKSFCGGGKKRDLICSNDKIVIPTALQ
jgi:hypothetical protein